MGIHNARNGCVLQGAVDTLRAISGFVPIVHSTIGCSYYAASGQEAGGFYSVLTGNGAVSANAVPSSNIIERQVIFGGGSRLREQIKNTVKVIKGEAYVVLSGCATEIIGDDIDYMAKESQQQGYPTFFLSTAGFRGNAYVGYETAVLGILKNLSLFGASEQQIEENTINLLGIPPVLDPYWAGSQRRMTKLLERIGLRVNRLFGAGSNIESWKQFPDATCNFVFSSWGLPAAIYAKEHFGTPYLEFDGLPLGSQTAVFLGRIGSELGISYPWIKSIIHRGEETLSCALGAIGSSYYTNRYQRDFVIVAPYFTAYSVLSYLESTLGLSNIGVVVTDIQDEEEKKQTYKHLSQITEFILFSEDTSEIADFIQNRNPELILGSHYESAIAKKLRIPLFEVSYPITQRILLTKGLSGYEGAVSLTEDLFSQIKNFKETESE